MSNDDFYSANVSFYILFKSRKSLIKKFINPITFCILTEHSLSNNLSRMDSLR